MTIENLKINDNIDDIEKFKVDREKSKKLTGFASIDKPWQQYFSKQAIDFNLQSQTMYDYMLKNAVRMKNATALNYYGTNISYGEVIEKIEACTKAFKQVGVDKGDIVTVLMPSSPEAVYIIYALNKIGATINPIDPRIKEEKLTKLLDEINPKMIVTLDLCSEVINQATKNHNVDNVVTVSAIESLPYGIRIINKCLENLKKYKTNSHFDKPFIKWEDFINNGKSYKGKTDYAYDFDRTAAIIYTGGTTGSKKGVKLSNNNINSMVEQHRLSGIPFNAGQKFLDFLPPFISYGLVMAIHMPLSFGFETNMVPVFTPKDFPKLILKSKPAYVFASPVHYESLLNYTRKKDLSFLKVPVSGGDSMSAEFEQKVDDELKKCHCSSQLGQGLGMTEAGGTMSVPIPNKIRVGSVGVPFANTVVSVFDISTGKELPYYEKGELCFYGPSLMEEYLNNPEETQNVLHKHADGKIWLHTGDIGYIDEDGYVYHIDRIKRIINRGGLKVYPSEVEKIVSMQENVKQCIVVGVDNECERHVPIAHIVIDSMADKNVVESEIINICQHKLDDESIPFGIKVRDSIPYTLNCKVDYNALAAEGYDGVDFIDEVQAKNRQFQKKLARRI
jgi:long-chain acyl-CoA synthetase